MNASMVSEAIAGELGKQGYRLGPDEYRKDLISAGVNSVNLVRLLSDLEELYDIEFEGALVFSEPVTVARLTEVIIGSTARNAEG